jgi:triacylglycerol esterase/lipase EstA (alpha/beta hydrolase family)
VAPALATPAQLGNFLQQTIAPDDPVALQLLGLASGLIRRYLGQAVTAVAGDVELRTPEAGSVFLKEGPVTAVSLVEVLDPNTNLWTATATTDYGVDFETGEVYRTFASNSDLFWWPTDRNSWRVTYDHGFETVPDDIAGVCYGLAARFYSTPAGIDQERTGQRQVKYSLTNDDFNPLELMVLDSYRNARVH